MCRGNGRRLQVSSRLFVKIRDVLGVPEDLRAIEQFDRRRKPCPLRKREREYKRLLIAGADRVAVERAAELNRRGVPAQTRRYRRSESLCVVYYDTAAQVSSSTAAG